MSRRTTVVVLTALALSALFWIDALFIPLVVLGPLITGIAAGPMRLRAATAVWGLAGIFALLSDWIINNEDQVFHLGIAVVTAALTFAVGSAANAIRRRRQSTTPRSTATTIPATRVDAPR